jgi:hypothetical protein
MIVPKLKEQIRLDAALGVVALVGLALVAHGWLALHGESFVAYKGAKNDLIYGAILLLLPTLRVLREQRRQ